MMKYILATDYDGTLRQNGGVSSENREYTVDKSVEIVALTVG